jgi:diguanylate cyclase (GGDEF)-like protein
MNLAKRASLLILPVVIISYTLIALFIYDRERSAIEKFETSKLELRAAHLKFSYSSYSRFIVSYLSSLIEGERLSLYLNDTDNIYREKMLTSHLEAAVNRFEGTNPMFASLSIFASNDAVKLYIENSTDPFAQIQPEQRELVAEVARKKRHTLWQYKLLEDQSIIQYAITLDPRTLLMPIVLKENLFRIIIAVKPEKFDALILQTKQDFNANVRFLASALPTQNLASNLQIQIKLEDNLFLLLTPDKNYLQSQLEQLTIRLSLIMLASIFLTFILLLWLIHKFITKPIELLDKQLTEIIEQKQDNIILSTAQDEVGRLARKFHSLYKALNSAFKETYAQTRIDPLTQIPNRVNFYEVAQAQLLIAQQLNTHLAIVYLDIDEFKFVNDSYGHRTGDELLKSIANKLEKLISNTFSDTKIPQVYRLSGDEFIILLPGQDTEHAQQISRQILDVFDFGFDLEDRYITVSASIGITSFPLDGNSISQLVSNADLTMYQAKKTGRNQLAVYSNALAEDERKLREISKLLKEINFDQEFSLYYMPIIDKAGGYKGSEALLRWHSPTLGSVSPADFIPIAESSGLFELIDMWVIERAFKDFSVLNSSVIDNSSISINISSAEINSDRFILQLQNLCDNYNIPTASFILEITETVAMEQSRKSIHWLERIKQLGFQIAIDDFGTGYTSLMQMVNYPVDIIKFDKILVERITQSGQQHLAQALINLCHIQGMSVVAEGVELSAQSHCLRQANCDLQQGFLLAKPMPLKDLQQWLKLHYLKKSDILK